MRPPRRIAIAMRVVEFADDTEMSRREASAEEFQRVIGMPLQPRDPDGHSTVPTITRFRRRCPASRRRQPKAGTLDVGLVNRVIDSQSLPPQFLGFGEATRFSQKAPESLAEPGSCSHT